MIKQVKILCFLLLAGHSLFSQDNNYWSQQYGNVSTLLGGAVVGSYKDNGSIYYNPATLSFTDTIKISLSAALYQSSLLHISNATATDTAYNAYGFKRFPISFYPVFRLNNKSRLGFIYLLRIYSNIKLHDYKNELKDVTNSGKMKRYIGTFDYENRLEESWYGLSYSRVLNKNSSFGLAVYCSYRNQNFTYQYTADVVLDDVKHEYLNTDIYHFLDYDLYKGIIKLGYYHEKNDLSYGGALTLPSFYVLSYSRSSSRFYFSGWQPYLHSDTINSLLISDEINDERINHKYPASFSIGIKKKFLKYNLFLTGEVYFPIENYELMDLEESENTFPVNYRNATDLLLNAETESRLFGNVAVGVEIKIKRNRQLIAGFSTDFNSLPASFDPKGFNISTGRNNIYNLTTGMDIEIRNIKINGGIKLSYGYSRNQKQFVDMTSASTNNFLIGERDYNSNYNYYALNLLLGFNF